MDRLNAWAPRVLSLLRFITALLFIEHGLMKLISFPAPVPGLPHPLPALAIFAGILETIGGGLVLVGLFTRPVAFLLSGEMAIAYFMVHTRQGPWPALNGGEPAILYCWIFLYLVFAGPGSWTLDARFARRSAEP